MLTAMMSLAGGRDYLSFEVMNNVLHVRHGQQLLLTLL